MKIYICCRQFSENSSVLEGVGVPYFHIFLSLHTANTVLTAVDQLKKGLALKDKRVEPVVIITIVCLYGDIFLKICV